MTSFLMLGANSHNDHPLQKLSTFKKSQLFIEFPWLNNLKYLDGRKSHFFCLKYLFFHPWDSATWAAVPLVPSVAPMMSGSGEGTLKRGEKLDTTGKLKSHRLHILHYGRVSTYYMCV